MRQGNCIWPTSTWLCAVALSILVLPLGCDVRQEKPPANGSNRPEQFAPTQSPTQNAKTNESAAAVRERFEQLLAEHIERIKPRLRQKVQNTKYAASFVIEGPGRYRPVPSEQVYSAEYINAKYDIQRTDSIVSPYLATASFSIRWYCDGAFTSIQSIECSYAYTDGVWRWKSGCRAADGKPLATDWDVWWVQSLFSDRSALDEVENNRLRAAESEAQRLKQEAEARRQSQEAQAQQAQERLAQKERREAEADQRLTVWQLEKASNGFASAQCSIGLRYLNGKGVATDEALARYWLEKAAAQDNMEAKAALSKMTNAPARTP